MRIPSKTALTLVTGIAVTGAIIGSTLPASAAHKGATSSRPAAQTIHTGSATKVTHAALPNLRTGDACSSYSDGHGDLCLWYLYNYTGSNVGILRNDSNLADDIFVGAGSGQYANATNNSESTWNYDRFNTVYVATSPGYTGYVGAIGPWSGGNFTSTYVNNVESLFWAA